MSAHKRKAIITGGSKGIGKAIAERFAQENIDIFLLASNEENLAKTASELKSKYKVNIQYQASDLKTKEGCNSVINIIENEFQNFDTLIFSAGATKSGDFIGSGHPQIPDSPLNGSSSIISRASTYQTYSYPQASSLSSEGYCTCICCGFPFSNNKMASLFLK